MRSLEACPVPLFLDLLLSSSQVCPAFSFKKPPPPEGCLPCCQTSKVPVSAVCLFLSSEEAVPAVAGGQAALWNASLGIGTCNNKVCVFRVCMLHATHRCMFGYISGKNNGKALLVSVLVPKWESRRRACPPAQVPCHSGGMEASCLQCPMCVEYGVSLPEYTLYIVTGSEQKSHMPVRSQKAVCAKRARMRRCLLFFLRGERNGS